MLYRGNWKRLKECMQKARRKEPVTIGFLGGSVTQGSCASEFQSCYAYLVYDWWRKKFPQTEMTYLNAGVGGTDSQFGAARAEEQLLKYRPDFVLIEFAVNDENTEFFKETYEGLIRKVYGSAASPALLLLNNVRYDDGSCAQKIHLEVAKAYELPMVSMKEELWPLVESGKISSREITVDDLHPNDKGHAMVAKVVICFLEQVYQRMEEKEQAPDFRGKPLPAPITSNAYEHSVRYKSYNAQPKLEGFRADQSPKNRENDSYRCGWIGFQKGHKISFEMVCTGVAVQYKRMVTELAPTAKVVVDDDPETMQILEAGFPDGWGEWLCLCTVTRHMEKKKHKVEIEIVSTQEKEEVPFYLVSVIGSE